MTEMTYDNTNLPDAETIAIKRPGGPDGVDAGVDRIHFSELPFTIRDRLGFAADNGSGEDFDRALTHYAAELDNWDPPLFDEKTRDGLMQLLESGKGLSNADRKKFVEKMNAFFRSMWI